MLGKKGLMLLFLTAAYAGGAQLPTALKFTAYNEATTAAAGSATCFLQARDGFLWCGTSNGLLRFDGYTFQPYFNAAGYSNTINHLAEDGQGRIWMSFLSGELAQFNPATGAFANYKLQNDKDASIGGGEVTALFFDSANQLWVGVAQKGLIRADVQKGSSTVYRIADEQSALYAPALRGMYNTVYAIRQDGADALWLATHDGLYRFAKSTGTLQSFREEKFRPGAMRRDLLNSILPDGDSLWFGSWEGGLVCYNKKTARWHHFALNEDDYKNGSGNIVTGVAAKSGDELWIASHSRGLGVFNKKKEGFTFFSNNPQYPNIPGSNWGGLTTDKDRNVWALQAQGLVKISLPDYPFSFEPFGAGVASDVNFLVTGVWEDEGLRLTGTTYANGLYVLNKRTGRQTALRVDQLPREEKSQCVRDIFEDSRHRIWIVARDFIYGYDRQTARLVKTPQPPLYSADSISNNFNGMAEDADGNLWIATRRNGIFVWNGNDADFFHFGRAREAEASLSYNNIVMTERDGRGRMWLTSMDGELSYINPKTKRLKTFPAGYGDKVKMPGNKAYALHRDGKGNMWVGSFSGLYYFNCGTAEPQLEKVFRGADGLRSDLVYSIQEDAHGNVWCASDAAICLLPKGAGPVRSFGTADGLISNGGKLVAAPANGLRVLDYGGWYDFRPAKFFAAAEPSPLVITAMQVADKPFYYGEGLRRDGVVNLASDQNFFSFEFATLNYRNPEKERYYYKLEGVDKDWIDAGSRRFVSYTNIPGGHYTFTVKAAVDGDEGSRKAVRLPLFIATPFYKSFPFYAALFVVLGGSLYAFLHYRFKKQTEVYGLQGKTQLLEKEKALVQYEGLKQQLNPHFLFNSLTSLNSLIMSEPKKAKQFLEQMSKIYRYILSSRDSELVSLGDEIKFVQSYISLQQTRFKESLVVRFAIDDSYHYCKIVPVTLQNLIENAIKHNVVNDERPLLIELFTEDGCLTVRNNLQKKTIVEGSNRQGLKSMKALYGYLTAKPMLIEESTERFTVKIPLIE